jgi:hypothetical protein
VNVRKDSRKRPHGEDAAARDRDVKALDLRIAGATYRQIGQQLAVSEKTAYYDVQDELGRLDKVSRDKAERLRDLEGRRLDVLQLALAPAIRTGDPRAIAAAVRLMERRAKLFGLDAPTTIAGIAEAPVNVVIQHRYVRDDGVEEVERTRSDGTRETFTIPARPRGNDDGPDPYDHADDDHE